MSAYSLATPLRISARKGFRLSIFWSESVEMESALSNPCVSAGLSSFRSSWRAPGSSSFLAKKLGKLVKKFPAEGFGKELGRECGLQLGKDLGTVPDSLLGKEPDKEL